MGKQKSLIDMTGKVCGRWTVLRRCSPPETNIGPSCAYWLCRCECNVEKPVAGSNLRNGTAGCASCSHKLPHPWKRIRPFESLFNHMCRGAAAAPRQDRKIMKRERTLTYEEFLTFTALDKCHYCWSPIAWTEFDIAKNGTRYNLDRKDNGRGYDLDNLVVCCKDCNAAKGSRYDYETWFGMTEFLRNRKRGN